MLPSITVNALGVCNDYLQSFHHPLPHHHEASSHSDALVISRYDVAVCPVCNDCATVCYYVRGTYARAQSVTSGRYIVSYSNNRPQQGQNYCNSSVLDTEGIFCSIGYRGAVRVP